MTEQETKLAEICLINHQYLTAVLVKAGGLPPSALDAAGKSTVKRDELWDAALKFTGSPKVVEASVRAPLDRDSVFGYGLNGEDEFEVVG